MVVIDTKLFPFGKPQPFGKGCSKHFVKDLTGRTLYGKNTTVEKGSNFSTLTELQNAQVGTYFIEVVCGGDRSFAKVMKR